MQSWTTAKMEMNTTGSLCVLGASAVNPFTR